MPVQHGALPRSFTCPGGGRAAARLSSRPSGGSLVRYGQSHARAFPTRSRHVASRMTCPADVSVSPQAESRSQGDEFKPSRGSLRQRLAKKPMQHFVTYGGWTHVPPRRAPAGSVIMLRTAPATSAGLSANELHPYPFA